MTKEEIQKNIYLAMNWITDNDPFVWKTPELNICSHLRSSLANQFSLYNVDVELRKESGQRPDISIHIRDTNDNNLVAFEVKIKPSLKQIKSDLLKITETYFKEPYFYKFGAFVCIGEIKEKIPEYDENRIMIFTVSGYGIREDLIKKDKVKT